MTLNKRTNRKYYKDYHNEFPKVLMELSQMFANLIGFKNYEPQASIVNFYHLGFFEDIIFNC